MVVRVVMVRMVVPVDEKVRRRLMHAFVPLSAAQEASVVEHVLGHRVQRPIVALARVSRFPGDFDETVVE